MPEARRRNYGVSFLKFVHTIRDESVGLDQMRKSLDELAVLHEAAAKKKKIKIIDEDNARASDGVFYLLPEALVNRAVGSLYATVSPHHPQDLTRSQSQADSQADHPG